MMTRCPRCSNVKLYVIRRSSLRRCAQCRYDFSDTARTALHARKKPREWYARVLELHRQGVNPYRISKTLGMGDAKSIYVFGCR